MTAPMLPVGVLDGTAPARVDAAGSVLVERARLQWWIGAADRWHRPDQEVAVRRNLLDGAPVVQTALRIPGGDARVHCYGAVVAGREWVVVDVVNDSRAPVAVALVADGAGPRAARPAAWQRTGAALLHDGAVLTVANRPADGWCRADDLEALAARLAAGEDDPSMAGQGEPETAGAVAQVFAVAHGTGVRVLLAPRPEPGGSGADAQPLAAPTPEAVIRGWRRQLDAVCRFRLGDDDAERDVFERRCRLLLDRDAGDPVDISALAGLGHGAEAARRLDRALSALVPPVMAGAAAALLVAMADTVAWANGADEAASLAELLAPPAVELAGWARGPRRRRGHSTDPTEQALAVADWAMARLVARGPGGAGRATVSDRAVAAVAAQRAASVAAGGDGAALLAVRAGLVVDDAPGPIDLLPGWSPPWRGRALDVHGLPTRDGAVSFAVRWHGPRPALLWQLDGGSAAGGGAVRLSCHRLDPGFVTDRREGEALLAEPGGGADGASSSAGDGVGTIDRRDRRDGPAADH